MSNGNDLTLVGTLTKNPELRFTNGGHAVCSFGLAWAPRKRNANGDWEDGETSFFNCSAWRDLGENIAATLSKGDRVIVTGSVSARGWEDKNGNKRDSIEIQVDECGPSLRWATAQIERTQRGNGSAPTASAPSAPAYANEEPF